MSPRVALGISLVSGPAGRARRPKLPRSRWSGRALCARRRLRPATPEWSPSQPSSRAAGRRCARPDWAPGTIRAAQQGLLRPSRGQCWSVALKQLILREVARQDGDLHWVDVRSGRSALVRGLEAAAGEGRRRHRPVAPREVSSWHPPRRILGSEPGADQPWPIRRSHEALSGGAGRRSLG